MTRRRSFATRGSIWTTAVSRRPSRVASGTHLVSVGNLIAGSRAGTSPTTLLATLVSIDPIYLDFDMSEADYMTFLRERQKREGPLAEKVQVSLERRETLHPSGHAGLHRQRARSIERHDPCPRHRAEQRLAADAGRVRSGAPASRARRRLLCWCRTRPCCRTSPVTSS